MRYQILDWDSMFFQKRISSLELGLEDSPKDVFAFLQNQNDYDCCYVFCPASNDNQWGGLVSVGGILMDRKVCLSKLLTIDRQTPCKVEGKTVCIKELDVSTHEAVELAVRSGWKSRFKKDLHFSAKQPELYRRWLEKGFEFPTMRVFGFYNDRCLRGLASASVNSDEKLGKLELIAVDADSTKRGIGTALLNAVEDFWLREHCVKGKIVTQLDNISAMSFYRRNGYSIISIQEVWHVWRQPNE